MCVTMKVGDRVRVRQENDMAAFYGNKTLVITNISYNYEDSCFNLYRVDMIDNNKYGSYFYLNELITINEIRKNKINEYLNESEAL